MQFSNTTTKDGVLQMCEYYTGLGNTVITGNSDTLLEFTAYVNSAMRSAWHLIHSSTGMWEYDDSNNTDLPQATTAVVDAQAKYALPSDALTVKRVEYKDQNGLWFPLRPTITNDIGVAVDEFLDVDGYPIYYRLLNDTIELFPAPNYSQNASLKIYYDRGSVSFSNTDTTKTPGFASEYHDFVPLEASLKWLKINLPADARTAQIEKDKMVVMENMQKYYTGRFKNKKAVIRRRRVTYK